MASDKGYAMSGETGITYGKGLLTRAPHSPSYSRERVEAGDAGMLKTISAAGDLEDGLTESIEWWGSVKFTAHNGIRWMDHRLRVRFGSVEVP